MRVASSTEHAADVKASVEAPCGGLSHDGPVLEVSTQQLFVARPSQTTTAHLCWAEGLQGACFAWLPGACLACVFTLHGCPVGGSSDAE